MTVHRSTALGPICKACGKVPPKTPDVSWSDWEQMAYCGGSCIPPSEAKSRRLAEDLAWLADTDTWDSISARLGFASLTAMERHLHRVGLHGWATRTRPLSLHDQRAAA